MIRTNDPRVTAILEKRAHACETDKRIKTYRAVNAGRESFADRFPDGFWKGQRCFIIGGGPSLKGFDFSRLRGERVIAINKAFLDAPFADIMFAMDRPLLDLLIEGKLGENYKQAFADFAGAKVWLDLSGYSYPAGIYSIPSAGATGWSASLSQGLVHGNNSGYGALNLAILLGADPIYLLGYDCARGKDGEKNYHSGYPSGSNPDAMNIFKREIEAGARVLANGPRIVNLNPNSALTCFPFGNVDEVLPKAAPITVQSHGITAITPTGDRPLAFGLLRKWIQHQTVHPTLWVVVDDGKVPMVNENGHEYLYVRREPQPGDPKHTLDLNMKTALPHITGNKIIICEDDEYYAPSYIEEMARRLNTHEVVGICRSKYYHLPTGGYVQMGNTAHASLAETGFRASFLPAFVGCINRGIVSNWIDTQIWKIAKKDGLFVDSAESLYIGMKGLPGRAGMGSGHDPKMYRGQIDGTGRPQLKKWIPKDYQVYLDVLAGMK